MGLFFRCWPSPSRHPACWSEVSCPSVTCLDPCLQDEEELQDKDCMIFLIDAQPAMLQSSTSVAAGGEAEPPPFIQALSCVAACMRDNIMAGDQARSNNAGCVNFPEVIFRPIRTILGKCSSRSSPGRQDVVGVVLFGTEHAAGAFDQQSFPHIFVLQACHRATAKVITMSMPLVISKPLPK